MHVEAEREEESHGERNADDIVYARPDEIPLDHCENAVTVNHVSSLSKPFAFSLFVIPFASSFSFRESINTFVGVAMCSSNSR